MTTNKNRRVGRKRWSALVAFLTDKMQNAASERVQMSAAMRLADILTIREQREQLELRRELRDAGKPVEESQDSGQSEGSPDDQRRDAETAEQFLARIGARHTGDEADE